MGIIMLRSRKPKKPPSLLSRTPMIVNGLLLSLIVCPTGFRSPNNDSEMPAPSTATEAVSRTWTGEMKSPCSTA